MVCQFTLCKNKTSKQKNYQSREIKPAYVKHYDTGIKISIDSHSLSITRKFVFQEFIGTQVKQFVFYHLKERIPKKLIPL